MTSAAIMDTIAGVCALMIPIGMALPWIVRKMAGWLASHARPRYLVSHGVRRRAPQAGLKP